MAIVFLVATLVAPEVLAAGPPSVAPLVRSARYWQQRGREDKAAAAWNGVLAADPRSTEALAALINRALKIGQGERARELLARLREVAPDSAEVVELERAVELGRRYESILAEGRSLARAGRAEDAVRKYRELFAGSEPPTIVALEFYQTLGGTSGGWTEARDGLQRLAARYPSDRKYGLALARHLTYREETRLQGLRQLNALAMDASIGREADDALRQALTWMGNSAAAEPFMTAYLQRHPEDKEMAGTIQQRRRIRERGGALSAAYAALDQGELDEASRRFDALGKDDARAVAGLAMVALRRAEFEKATELFETANRLRPAEAEAWAPALLSARFWTLVQRAEVEHAAGRIADAEKKLLEAVALSPAERVEADALLAGIFRETGRYALAEERLRLVLKAKPGSWELKRELIAVLLRLDQLDEALRVNEDLRRSAPAHAFSDHWMQSEALRARAAVEREEGRAEQARALLLEAEREDAKNPWVAFDLAELLLELNEVDEAGVRAERAASLEPENAAVQALGIRLLEARGRPVEAIAALQRIPAERMTAELKALQRRLGVRLRIKHALEQDERRRLTELEQLENQIGAVGDDGQLLADGWVAAGDKPRAIKLLRRIVGEKGAMGFGAHLQLASLLLDVAQEDEALRLIEGLQNQPGLAASERRGLENLQIGAAIRMADALGKKGRGDEALKLLQTASTRHPDSLALKCAVGRQLLASGDPEAAHAAFSQALVSDSMSMEAREGAILAARSMGDQARANALMEEAIRLAPRDPRTHLMAGRFAAGEGDDTRAMEELRQVESLLVDAHADPRLRADLDEETSRIRTRHAFRIDPAVGVRYRAGEPGLGLLTAFGLSVGVGLPLAYRGRLSLFVEPTLLNGGTPNVADGGTAQRFGALMEVPVGLALGDEVAQGAALRLRYEEPMLTAELGSTPLGFPAATAVGRIRWAPKLGEIALGLDLFRQAVTDSVLSFAGLKDPVTLRTWGGVVRNAGRVELSRASMGLLVFGYFQYGLLHGTEVPFNTSIEGGLGTEWTFLRQGDSTLTGGVDGLYLGYARNLRYFTLGQGGYFSPQAFFHAGIPVKWQGGSKFRWDLQVELGANWFQEASSIVYPTDGGLQTARQASLTDAAGNPRPAQFPARTSAGFALDARAAAWLPLTRSVEGSLEVQYHRANDYEELTAGFAVRFDIVPGNTPKSR